MVNTFFQFELKDDAIEEIRRVLRPNGVLYVIDWSESFGGLGPQPKDVVTKEKDIDLFEAKQFILEREYETGDHHYGIAMRKV